MQLNKSLLISQGMDMAYPSLPDTSNPVEVQGGEAWQNKAKCEENSTEFSERAHLLKNQRKLDAFERSFKKKA